jgi:SAM-dependent methyltransferase
MLGINKAMSFLRDYAEVYDAIHADRDFAKDVTTAVEALQKVSSAEISSKSILDFGCGTGHHLNEFCRLAKRSIGYDRSPAMIQMAHTNFPHLKFTSRLSDLDTSFDCVFSLFDVVSYQKNMDELSSYLSAIASCLITGGHAVFDGWHSPGVRISPPEYREKLIDVKGEKYLRRVLPVPSEISDSYSLKITIENLAKSEVISDELHEMKAWEYSEIEMAARSAGLKIMLFSNRNSPTIAGDDEKYWRFIAVLKKIG